MDYVIDTTHYQKPAVCAMGVGYDKRPNGIKPSSVVIHTTNGVTGSSFDAEANYLIQSQAVSAHYLVGKAGQIAEMLNPRWRAWHAGVAVQAWTNTYSIGIENHFAIGETWTDVQHDALTYLVRRLMHDWSISPRMIETHRKVALPAGRKVDPSGWDDPAFYAWRDTLTPLDPAPIAALFCVAATDGVNIRASADPGAAKLGALAKGACFHGAIVIGISVQGEARWVARLPSEGGGWCWFGALKQV